MWLEHDCKDWKEVKDYHGFAVGEKIFDLFPILTIVFKQKIMDKIKTFFIAFQEKIRKKSIFVR